MTLEWGVREFGFDTINIEMTGGVDIKGHTFVVAENKHVYTSSAGIQSYSSADPTFVAPADYGYLHVSYFYNPMGEDASEGRTQETTFLLDKVMIPEGHIPSIQLLVDTYKVAYYWDGSDASRHGFVETMPYHDPGAFPTGTPVIGVTYIPFYVAVDQNIVSETYVIATDAADLSVTGDSFDIKRVMFMTLLFDEDTGEFYQGRTANWDGLDVGLHLPQFVTGAQFDGTDYDLDLDNYDDGAGWTERATIESFVRQNLGDTGTATEGFNTIHYKRVR